MSVRRTFAIAALLVGCALLAGCSRLLSLGNSDALTPASAEDCEKFGHELEQAVAADDAARTTELIGLAGLFRRATADFEGSAEYKAQLRKHAEEDARNDPFVPLLLASVRRGAQVKLLRVHAVDGRSRALVRYISPRGSVEYFDFLPARGSDGLVAEDIQLAANGELASQTLRRLQLKVAAEQNHGPPGHPPSSARIWVPQIPKLNAMYKQCIDRKYAEAVATYKSLPSEVRADKSVFLRYLWAAEAVSDTEFLLALDGFRRQFPNDPGLVFQNIDYYRLMRSYDAALQSIDKAEKVIGGDPYLNALRAKLLVKGWKFREARAAANKAIEQEPGLTHGYWGRIDIALAEANHPDTLAYLKKLVENTGHVVGDLRKDSDFAVFVRSAEYQEWVVWCTARKN
jgi:tetratricopeptide (TPR) repeat protein